MAHIQKTTDLNGCISRFLAGTADDAYTFLGAHPQQQDGQSGYVFRVWAPHARGVSIMGNFNDWDPEDCPMSPLRDGIWEKFLPGIQAGEIYKYAIHTQDGRMLAKADPYAVFAEVRPNTASRLYDLSGYEWGDANWLEMRRKKPVYHKPMNIYEVHLGSWRRTADNEFLSYRDTAAYLVPYVKEMGYTHVELLPVTEYPLDMSWGYQVTGYYAPTSRYGEPHDFMYLIDSLHQAGIGVILDWVPAHFPKDAFGLYEFDGAPCYEYADLRKGEHPEWGTRVFDFGRNEVKSFLISSAMYWLNEFHLDGLRVDAVASMLYLDYGRSNGQWVANQYGGRENLEAVAFLRQLNSLVFKWHPDVLMVAEESTSWEHITGPLEQSDTALGFNYKWNMGWMNDALHYQKMDAYFRQFNHRDLTFPLMYAFNENFILPISHDEVVHMKGSMLGKMPGDDNAKMAGVRAFYVYMMTMPGKKLSIMGTELGQFNEWHYEYSLDWHLLEYPQHQKHQAFFKALNAFYLSRSELWEVDDSWDGFQWVEPNDATGNTLIYLRKNRKKQELLIAVNFSPIHRKDYYMGVPVAGTYEVLFNSDDEAFGGQGRGDHAPLKTKATPCHGFAQTLVVDLPPLSGVILRCTRKNPVRTGSKKTASKQTDKAKIATKRPKTT
jgi:1,4-alpha-glucan branching enzyme